MFLILFLYLNPLFLKNHYQLVNILKPLKNVKQYPDSKLVINFNMQITDLYYYQ